MRRRGMFMCFSALVAVFSIAWSADAAVIKVSVAAGAYDRSATPVAVDIDYRGDKNAAVMVTSETGRQPGQLEISAPGKARIWWVISALEAGTSRTYSIELKKSATAAAVFTWKDTSGDHGKSRDLVIGKRPVLRYMHTPFDPGDIEHSKKPFHHVYSPDGRRFITNGPGNGAPYVKIRFPHHRGIYFGYNRCKIEGRGSFDTWHAHKGEHQLHTGFTSIMSGPVVGGHTATILWKDRDKKPFAREERTLITYLQPDGTLLIDFSTTLRAIDVPVDLGGDRQHAGAQFRAIQAVANNEKATRYLRPEKWKDLAPEKQYNDAAHKDLPWNALQFKLDGSPYTVAYLSHPENPDNAEFSERLYGRFGEFFPWKLTVDNPLTISYRFWVSTSGEVTREQVQAKYNDFAEPPVAKVVR